MMDLDTFLTTVYVLIEDRGVLPADPPQPGPRPRLTRSAVLTLAIVGQWAPFAGDRAFYRDADRHLRRLFPPLPHRAQFNRLVRHGHDALVAVGQQVATWLAGRTCADAVLDGMGGATRNSKRRGSGWLDGPADSGLCTRLGWDEGLHLLTVVTPRGALTGWGLAPASTNDRPLAETLRAARATPQTGLPAAGARAACLSLADKGFGGSSGSAAGWPSRGRACSARPSTGTACAGRAGCGTGTPACARSWRPATTAC
jgi:hypothetical protein